MGWVVPRGSGTLVALSRRGGDKRPCARTTNSLTLSGDGQHDEESEGLINQVAPGYSQLAGCGQIDFPDRPGFIQGQEAHRGEVLKIAVFSIGFF